MCSQVLGLYSLVRKLNKKIAADPCDSSNLCMDVQITVIHCNDRYYMAYTEVTEVKLSGFV